MSDEPTQDEPQVEGNQPPPKKHMVEKAIQALQPKAFDARPAPSAAMQTQTQTTETRIAAPSEPPWTLQQFFNGEIDLDAELTARSKNMPVMSTFKRRSLGKRSGRSVVTIATQDGAAQVIFDADPHSKIVQMSFTYGSMLTLHFRLDGLSDMDRERWLELMNREAGGLAFLWGPARWEKDYMICIVRKYFTNVYAFSPNSFDASIRMTPDVTRKLLDWLGEMWQPEAHDDDTPPAPLLTW